MEREKLIRKLNSVGKEVFVKYYDLFRDYSRDKITKRSAIQKLVDDEVSNEDGAAIRLSNARIIFNGKGNCEALLLVQKSQKLSEQIIRAAKEVSRKECA
jgi:hypothetical protein